MVQKVGRVNNTVPFSKGEERFIMKNEVCRVSTSHNDIPHVTPVSYICKNGSIFFATDYNTRKYKNLKLNNKIALSIDTYGSSVKNKAVVIQGIARLIERGEEFKQLYQEFYNKFEWVRQDPWKEGEAPFVKVDSLNKVSWGL